jgi:hypothetical protein
MNCEIENKINICTGLVATAIFKKMLSMSYNDF